MHPDILKPISLEAVLRNDPLPHKTIRAMPVPDLYFALRDMGDDTRREALMLANPEQVQGIFDLGVWDRDEINLTRLREWFAELGSMPPGRLVLHFLNLDPELLVALLITEFIIVPAGAEFEEDAPNREADWKSPDDRFWLWRRAEPISGEAQLGGTMLDLIYSQDPELARRLLMQAATGLASEMEETAYRFRDARLLDMGFPSMDSANGIWQPRPTPERIVEEPSLAADTPRYLATRAAEQGRFRDRLAELPAGRQEAAAAELVMLTNAALISETVAMHDREAVQRTLSMVAGFLDLGLEQPDGEKYLRSDLRALFQLGLGTVAPLSRRARALTRSHAFDRWGHSLILLEPGEAEFLRALARPHPQFSDPRAHEGRRTGFAKREQLALAEETLGELEAAALFLFGEQGIATASNAWESEELHPPREERTIRTLVGTFLARIVLKLPPSVEPVERKDIERLLAGLDKLGGFREGLEKLAASTTPLGAWLRREADAWLEDLHAAGGKVELVDSVLF